MSTLFVSGLAPEMDANSLAEYLKEKQLYEGCTSEKMKTKKDCADSLKVIHYNVRSIRNKLDEFEASLVNDHIDIIVLTEHWLRSEEMSSFKISNYKSAT
ncbi:hypothetical protein HHI36_003010 [Cryptolaemus montrouzieri]|uniref:Rna-directed dna polymerase from mobile element jockey-like n=1 Tax=Cryptolaemus montrouzieri TaxID=559131 RepID=A0ABD2PC71_9CUCU